MAWTEERIGTLLRLWKDGLSASRIARQFGDVSRNAVLGKLHRMGISDADRPKKPVVSKPMHLPPPPPPKPADPEAPEPLNIPMVKVRRRRKADSPRYYKVAEISLTNHTCKWPTHYDGQHLFCGHPVAPGDGPPYCPHHRNMAGAGYGTGHRHTPETIAAMKRAAAKRRAA